MDNCNSNFSYFPAPSVIMRQYIHFLLSVGAIAGSACAQRVPFSSKSKPALASLAPTTASSLAIRGGGLLEPKFFTNAMTAASLGQGLLSFAAPEVSMDAYGASDEEKADVYSRYMTQTSGAAILSIGVLAFCIFTLDVEPIKAIGWSSLVWITHLGRTMLNKIPEKMGSSIKSNNEAFWLAMVVFQTYAAFTGKSYAKNLLLAAFGLGSVSSLSVVLSPQKTAEFFGLSQDMTKEQLWSNRNQAYACLAMSTFILSMMRGLEPQMALGYMSLPFIVHMIHGYLDTGKKDNYPFVPVLIWMLFHSASFMALALK